MDIIRFADKNFSGQVGTQVVNQRECFRFILPTETSYDDIRAHFVDGAKISWVYQSKVGEDETGNPIYEEVVKDLSSYSIYWGINTNYDYTYTIYMAKPTELERTQAELEQTQAALDALVLEVLGGGE